MDLVQAVVLALVQGLTEFLPVSSSGHLVLAPVLLGWPDQGLAFDVAVHLGTLLAVLAYFRADLLALARALPAAARGADHADARLLRHLVVATVPVVLAGLLYKDWIEANLRSPLVIAWTMAGFGLVLGLSDYLGRRSRRLADLTWRGALLVGLAQALALVPGTSRSGVTMSAALLLGLTRVEAARFSFLLSIPTILAAGVLKGADLAAGGVVDGVAMAVGVVLSALSAYACIAVFLAAIERIGVWPFVVYRLALGALLFALFA